MNRGKVVGLVLLWTIVVNYLSMMPFLIEIPKLASRVDELNLSIEARDEVLKALNQRNESLAVELQKEEEKVATLVKLNAAKDKKIAELRKKTTVTPVLSRGQDYREMGTLGSNFQVTWYNDYGYTKSGRFVTKNVTVAVDPDVIELGSWLKLEFPDGRELVRRADDTGGAVNGPIIDIYDNASDSTLRQRGRTHGVKVTLLRKN